MTLAANRPTSYTVRPGDTLWGIAQRVYGTGLAWIALGEANGIVDPRILAAGQILVVP